MKNTTRSKFPSLAASLLMALLLGNAGCSSSGYAKGDKAAANIRKAADQIALLNKDIERALGSLSDLVNNPQANLKPQFKRFSSDVRRVEKSAEHIYAARQSMADKGKAFFDHWDAQLAEIHNEDIRARSQSRRDEVAGQLLEIKVSYEDAAKTFKPFIADLKDVQRFLSLDLTPGGVSSAKEPLKKAMTDAIPVIEAVQDLANAFDALGLSMSSTGPAN
jgi:outer membrane murein-binding lipoprotein Lpp